MLLRLLTAATLMVTGAIASITDCDPTSVFRPTKLALNPDPPVRGQPVMMTVELNNPGAPVTDGTVTTSVTLNGIPFSPSTESLCENTVCPIVTGWNDKSATSTWPSTVSGKVVSKSQWFGTDGKSLLCVQTSVKVGATYLRHFHYEGEPVFMWDSSNSTASGSGASPSGSSSKSGGSSSGSSSGSGSNSGNSTSGGSTVSSGPARGCYKCLVAQ